MCIYTGKNKREFKVFQYSCLSLEQLQIRHLIGATLKCCLNASDIR